MKKLYLFYGITIILLGILFSTNVLDEKTNNEKQVSTKKNELSQVSLDFLQDLELEPKYNISLTDEDVNELKHAIGDISGVKVKGLVSEKRPVQCEVNQGYICTLSKISITNGGELHQQYFLFRKSNSIYGLVHFFKWINKPEINEVDIIGVYMENSTVDYESIKTKLVSSQPDTPLTNHKLQLDSIAYSKGYLNEVILKENILAGYNYSEWVPSTEEFNKSEIQIFYIHLLDKYNRSSIDFEGLATEGINSLVKKENTLIKTPIIRIHIN